MFVRHDHGDRKVVGPRITRIRFETGFIVPLLRSSAESHNLNLLSLISYPNSFLLPILSISVSTLFDADVIEIIFTMSSCLAGALYDCRIGTSVCVASMALFVQRHQTMLRPLAANKENRTSSNFE